MAVKQFVGTNEEIAVIMPYDNCQECHIDELGEITSKPVYSFVKRAFDIFCSVIVLLIFSLPMAIIALLVKSTSKGNVFYKQERVGINGKIFTIIKFRTMYMDAEKDGIRWSLGEKDPRITRVGKFLRRTHLDELPQFWCILTGKMSFIGPRPEREAFYREFERYIHGFRERLKVKPGLTGLAQVRGGYNLRPEEKILFDVEYIKKRSLWLDIKITFMTVKVVFRREGVK